MECCGIKMRTLVSRTSKNPNREFYKCSICTKWGGWVQASDIAPDKKVKVVNSVKKNKSTKSTKSIKSTKSTKSTKPTTTTSTSMASMTSMPSMPTNPAIDALKVRLQEPLSMFDRLQVLRQIKDLEKL